MDLLLCAGKSASLFYVASAVEKEGAGTNVWRDVENIAINSIHQLLIR
jgi:hypothetical protein